MARRIVANPPANNAGNNNASGQAPAPVCPVSRASRFAKFFSTNGDEKSPLQIVAVLIAVCLLIYCIWDFLSFANGDANISLYTVFGLSSGLLFGVYIGGSPYVPLVLGFFLFIAGMVVQLTGYNPVSLFNGGKRPMGTIDAREAHEKAQKSLEDAQMRAEAIIIKASASHVVYILVKDFESLKAGSEVLPVNDKFDDQARLLVRPGKDGVYNGAQVAIPATLLKIKDAVPTVVNYGREKTVKTEKKPLSSPKKATVYKSLGVGDYHFTIAPGEESEGVSISGVIRYSFKPENDDYIIVYDDGMITTPAQENSPDVKIHHHQPRFKIINQANHDIIVTMSVKRR